MRTLSFVHSNIFLLITSWKQCSKDKKLCDTKIVFSSSNLLKQKNRRSVLFEVKRADMQKLLIVRTTSEIMLLSVSLIYSQLPAYDVQNRKKSITFVSKICGIHNLFVSSLISWSLMLQLRHETSIKYKRFSYQRSRIDQFRLYAARTPANPMKQKFVEICSCRLK